MRVPAIMAIAGGLALGVGLAFVLTTPLKARGPEPIRSSSDPPSKTDVPAPATKEQPAVTPPVDGQRTELAEGWVVYWQRGRVEVSGWRDLKPVWSRELAFPVADVVKGPSRNELKVVSVDALTSAVLDAATGELKGTIPREGQGTDAAVTGLLAQAKSLHADALAKMRAGDGRGTLAACDKMGELANRLSEAKRSNEAFRIWAAAKKLRRAVAPEQIGKVLPKEQQPGPEDLEF